MSSGAKRAGSIVSALALAVAIGMLALALDVRVTASGARDRALSLYRARLDVAEAEKRLGGSHIEDALVAARRANATAVRVGGVVRRIARTLGPAARMSAAALATARQGVQQAGAARRQTRIVGGILGAIAGYQESAEGYAAITNNALVRILKALRKTNEEFP